MPRPEIFQKLHTRLMSGDLSSVRVTYRIAGGPPGDHHVNDELILEGNGAARARSVRGKAAARLGTLQLDRVAHGALLRELTDSGSELVTRANARFLPDSLVGMVTVDVDGDTETLFFLADDVQRQDQGKQIAAKTVQALEGLARVADRALGSR